MTVGRPSRRVVYVSYDGLGDPLGRSQVLPYVEGLARRGHRFELITFEKPGTALRLREPLSRGVHWTALRYHRTPTVPATLFDMGQGALSTALASVVRGADLLHVRSYVAATLALPWSIATRTPLLFDMRGMWADEKVDAGAWPRDGRLYHGTKRVERTLLRRAHAITVLTHSIQRHLRDEYAHRAEIQAGISVIPTCTDLDTFHPGVVPDPETTCTLGPEARVLTYVGALGGWYMSQEMAQFYLAWRRAVAPAPARLLLVTRDEPSEIEQILAAAGVADEIVRRPASREQVPAFVRCGHAAMCFIKPSFSKRASAPTKLGEILACGLPVAANLVGDMADVLGGSDAGVVLTSMSPSDMDGAAVTLAQRAADPNTPRVARELAERWFSLDHALDRYEDVYASLGRGARRGLAHDTSWP